MAYIADPFQLAQAAALRYINQRRVPGIRRERRGDDFLYFTSRGNQILEPTKLDRFKQLRIPPAWQNVWICPDQHGHLQAVGYDEKGRRQYIYHPQWIQHTQETKFAHLVEFGYRLPRIRRRVAEHMTLPGLPKERVLATVVWLLENTFIRIGNKEYAKENNSYGLTTLRQKHIDIKGMTAEIEFTGKSGVKHELEVDNPRVVKTIRKCIDLPGYEVFKYIDENGKRTFVDSGQVNQYLKDVADLDITAKDFRTWGASKIASEDLIQFGPYDTKKMFQKNVRETVRDVSHHLRNTVSVCRKYYIHPHVLQSYEDNRLIPHYERITEAKHGLKRKEYALISLLEKYRTIGKQLS